MKKKVRTLAMVCALALAAGAFAPGSFVYAKSLEESIQEKQAAISEAENEKKKLQSGLSDIKALVNQLEASKKNLQSYVTQLDSQVAELEEKIQDLQEQISQKKKEIEQAKADTQAAQEVADQQYDDMKSRLRYLYTNSKDGGYLDVLFEARSFGDMVNQAEYVERLNAYDSQKLNEFEQNVEYLKLCRQTLEEEEEVLKEAESSLQNEQDSVNALISEKSAQIASYQKDINGQAASIQEYEDLIAQETEVITALEKAVAEDKAKLAEQNRMKYDGGMFQMPCPGYKRVSDDYGNRIHPITGKPQFHNGIDFAAASGTAILAAYDGKVVAATYNSSMGNYVMIDHGDDLYTIYMHASQLYVSAGQTVTKGEKIAAVGATGRATGPHLHFSVRLNGSYTSPWNYLK